MEQKDITQISSSLKTAYGKATDAIKKGNTDYAVEVLKSIVQKSPGFKQGRETLREQEKLKAENMGAIAKVIAQTKGSMTAVKGRSKVKKAPLEAMKIAEEALAMYLYQPGALNLLADAAVAADANFIAIEALELNRELQPKNEANLRKLFDVYRKKGDAASALQVMQKIAGLKPKDLEVQQELRAAAAEASMQEGKWEDEGSFQDKLKDKDESAEMEQKERIIPRNIDDINQMIERLEKRFQEGEESIDLQRDLAELYYRAKRFDNAVESYNWIVEKMGALDPAIDKGIERCYVGKFDLQIAQMKEDNASEEEIKGLEDRKYQYRLEKAVERVEKYPNDTELRYDLAVVYWDGSHVSEALEQFQYAQKSPHRRLNSMVYLGRCFAAKKQYDLAVEQLSKAVAEMPGMDKVKMDAVYHLGVIYENMGNAQKAMECFKDIYQSNVNFRDVSQRMEKFYDRESNGST